MVKQIFHEFRKAKHLKMQDNFVFVDTETNSIKEKDNLEILTFKLACAIFWNRKTDTVIKQSYFDNSLFWNDLESLFCDDVKEFILYAHNVGFDLKILNGYNELLGRGWMLDSHYVQNKTFIMTFKKRITSKLVYTLKIWDTMNYVPKSLASLGLSVGFPKMKVDFDTCTDLELEMYCKRDTEILYQFIKKLIDFLLENDLSNLKATIGSMSFNAFRHRFYTPITNDDKLYIHSWKRAIKLERESYKGGITDCFKIGEYQDIYKTDINSMYAGIMKKIEVPIKLLFNSSEATYSQETLFQLFNFANDNGYGVIMKATVKLPKDNAYILNNFVDKSIFAYGEFQVSICTPEINFVKKNGEILLIHHISIYQVKNLFQDFVSFFYDKRLEYKAKKNKINQEICKLYLNNLYGKWGQKEIEYCQLTTEVKFFEQNKEVIKLMVIRKKEIIENNCICYLGTIVNEGELYLIDKKLFYLKHTSKNTKESFVAISSFITSYARMQLINYVKIAKRNCVYYVDTDSLFVNQKGYDNLIGAGCINEFELGKLKKEAFGDASFYAPKFYDFVNEKDIGIFSCFLKERKCKGIKKGSVLLSENKDKAVYKVQLWSKYKSDLKDGNIDNQIIKLVNKESNKIYNKGNVDKLGNVFPFSISELEIET